MEEMKRGVTATTRAEGKGTGRRHEGSTTLQGNRGMYIVVKREGRHVLWLGLCVGRFLGC